MSIIGISGAQGQGKSTLIRATLEATDDIQALDIQTARSVLKEWGYTLAEVNTFMPLKIKFQEELFSRHCNALYRVKNDYTLGKDMYPKLVERTFADIFNYALTSLGPFNDYSNWLNEYHDKCMQAQNELFDHIIFLSGRTYVPEEDGVRSVNPHFSNMTDYLIQHYTETFSEGENATPVTFMTEPNLVKRVEQLYEIVVDVEVETDS